MENSQFSIQIRCFKLVGLDSHKKLSTFCFLFYIISLVFSLFSMILFVVRNYDDIQASADALGPFFTGIISLSKFLSFHKYREKFFDLIAAIELIKEKSSDAISLKKVVKFQKSITLMYLFATIFTGVAFCFAPILINILNGFHPVLPVKSEFLFDITQMHAYVIIYLLYCYVIYVTILISVGVDTFFFICSLNISTHFKILSENVSRNTKTLFIEKHLQLLFMSNNLKKLMKLVIFTQFFISSLNLCVLGFQVVTSNNVFQKIVVTTYALAIIIQLFVYSFGGQILKDRSMCLTDKMFSLDKDYVLIISRVQKYPVKIDSLFFDADLPTFRQILSRAGSLITLLRSLEN